MLPQLSLTHANVVMLTASRARELPPSTGSIADERRLALSSSLANACPFGAMPMCQEALGLATQFRFGAGAGLAPIIFAAALLVLAVNLRHHAAALLTLIPLGTAGSLLIFAGTDGRSHAGCSTAGLWVIAHGCRHRDRQPRRGLI